MSERLLAQRYRLVDTIGRGGMGTVWLGHDELLDRSVAVKEVRIAEGLPPDERDRLVERTMREARICAQLNHPAIVTVHDVVRVDERPWVVMELIEGRGLDSIVAEQGPLTPARAADVGAQAASALRRAHEAGVLHRDIKPANIMIDDEDQVVLTDFGIATQQGESGLTQAGVIGTPGYLAPEQLQQDQVGPAADLWALGATLYYLVEGRPAYRRETAAATAMAPLTTDPDPPQRAGSLWPLLEQLLSRDPTARPDVSTLESRLRAVGSDPGAVAAHESPDTAPGAAPPPEAAHRAAPPHDSDPRPAEALPGPAPHPGPAQHAPPPHWAPPAAEKSGAGSSTGRIVALVTAGVLVVAILGIVGVLLVTQVVGTGGDDPAQVAAEDANAAGDNDDTADTNETASERGVVAGADPVPECADVDGEVLARHIPDLEQQDDEFLDDPQGDGRYCEWESAPTTQEADGFASVLMLDNRDGPEAAATELDLDAQEFGGTPVEGIGDRAQRWYDEDNNVGCLGTATGRLYVRTCYDAARSSTDASSIRAEEAMDTAQEITENIL
ncbi:serine/threonine-protein kinase [Lipingzhangella sp. LS1_29]|uniref:non-specific serine/threonine protein kinase n=1 Tax=Lipingzhangella rawalii TaxID=2055835 RepID=A0ABU2H6Q3_9ACTN|nr:serine/threonine-protein kinase [Lipingzhangella rawalii]MDS1270986.1 serine/threonine-protein kinase [Lipingzhangella rawalii]